MTRRIAHGRTVLTALTAWSALAATVLWEAAPATAHTAVEDIARGVGYDHFDVEAAKGTTHAHVLTVDLTDPHVKVDLLHPGTVSDRDAVSHLADAQGAVAAINGDFFNNNESQHPGVDPTWASVGPAVADQRAFKGAVPDGQRHGPAMPPGVTTKEVLGVGTDDRARLDKLTLDGSVVADGRTLPLGGLNQYALPENAIGAYTPDWGSVSRKRPTCGTDTDRGAPCSPDVYEVTVRAGRVASTGETPGSGQVPKGSFVLVGREKGAAELRKLSVGDPVSERHRLVAARSRVAYGFAIGGFPVLRDGEPLDGLNSTASAPRAAAGFSADGKRLFLLALDGSPQYRTGLTLTELAALMRKLGAEAAINLDGGGSSTLVARKDGAGSVAVRNHPADGGVERLVSTGIGVFTRE
ncbi:phosphodiester glycosidase family protein [Streptomyces sp. NA04227]|uniref:phosphodiester glycosidase family protein n=1 Tax=Streptomyces sp. NA04227 TaxID=2742136 RepID=UPI0015922B8A|nr:phosphodiester glycosidase family protein [Streptomyces sp. NA04227]QKW10477.1 phosphodiester glycosidase family protein [Streptomyces sp. NA04227]